MSLNHAEYDVVVVGAGLAGLAAAYGLRKKRVLVLERDTRPGGRIDTVELSGVPVEFGASYHIHADAWPGSPETVAAPKILERGTFCCVYRGKTYAGKTPWECIQAFPFSAADRRKLEAFRNGYGTGDLRGPALAILEGLFGHVHLGNIAEYAADRQLDALRNYFPDHYVGGNRVAVEAYVHGLGPKVDIAYRTDVRSIDETPKGVTVRARRKGVDYEIRCKAVVVATPATVTRKLVIPDDKDCKAFLRGIRYAGGTIVGFAVKGRPLGRHRCVVAPGTGLALAIQQRQPNMRKSSLICGLSANATWAHLPDSAVIERTKRILAKGGFPIDESVLDAKVGRRPLIGTVITDEYLERKKASFSRATNRIFLAGDYLSTFSNWGYGTKDAAFSGRTTAALLLSSLKL